MLKNPSSSVHAIAIHLKKKKNPVVFNIEMKWCTVRFSCAKSLLTYSVANNPHKKCTWRRKNGSLRTYVLYIVPKSHSKLPNSIRWSGVFVSGTGSHVEIEGRGTPRSGNFKPWLRCSISCCLRRNSDTMRTSISLLTFSPSPWFFFLNGFSMASYQEEIIIPKYWLQIRHVRSEKMERRQ